MSQRNGGWPRLPLSRMSDIELLSIFEDAADGDGGATAVQVAEKTDEGIRAARAIGCRFAWLGRWGYMEQEVRTKKWYMTTEGEKLRAGVRVTPDDRRTLRRLATSPLGLGELIGQRISPDDRRMLRRQIHYHEVNP